MISQVELPVILLKHRVCFRAVIWIYCSLVDPEIEESCQKPKSPNTLLCFIPENRKKGGKEAMVPCQELVKKRDGKKKSPATQGVTGSRSSEYAQHYESAKNTLVCPYHDSCNYGLNFKIMVCWVREG